GEWIIRFFLLVMVHLISDCTHLTQCPKLLVRIIFAATQKQSVYSLAFNATDEKNRPLSAQWSISKERV
ncbi:hypothetical protein AB6D24_24385, partial [Vibrio splendidus]